MHANCFAEERAKWSSCIYNVGVDMYIERCLRPAELHCNGKSRKRIAGMKSEGRFAYTPAPSVCQNLREPFGHHGKRASIENCAI